MTLLVAISAATFVCLLWILRRDRISLGLPIAYLYSLLLIHVPGALAHIFGSGFFINSDLVEIGMRFATLGAVCFVIGVWLARRSTRKMTLRPEVDRPDFWWACLIGGWALIYGLTPLYHIASISAAIEKGGGIWMLGVLLGLRAACRDSDLKRVAIWVGALLVFPVLVLLLGGFLSYGAAAIVIACSVLTISIRSSWRLTIGVAIFVFLGMSIFVNYFEHRDNIRHEVWGGAPLETRIDSVIDIARDFQWLDFSNRKHLVALDQRLNQNYFIGLAAERIQEGQVNYLRGDSIWDGVISLIPRLLWPEKPVVRRQSHDCFQDDRPSALRQDLIRRRQCDGVSDQFRGSWGDYWLSCPWLAHRHTGSEGCSCGKSRRSGQGYSLLSPMRGSDRPSRLTCTTVQWFGRCSGGGIWLEVGMEALGCPSRQLEKEIFSSARSGPKSFAIKD